MQNVLYRYRIFDKLTQTYFSYFHDVGVWYNLSEVAEIVHDLSKGCIEENRFEVHAVKLADIQTLE